MPKRNQVRHLRARTIQNLKKLNGAEFTTSDLAAGMVGTEYQIRAVISWLVLCGTVQKCGKVERKDKRGRRYQAQTYRYTGKRPMERIPRNEVDRQAAMRAEDEDDLQELFRRCWKCKA